jgi:hypothetical protein
MNTWRKKFFAFLLALVAISAIAGPLASSTEAAGKHHPHHHHRRHHRHHHRR